MIRSSICFVSHVIGENANNQISLKREGKFVLMNHIGNIGDTLAHSGNMYSVRAKENFIDKKLMLGQKFRKFVDQTIHYLHLVEGASEDISEFVANTFQEHQTSKSYCRSRNDWTRR